MNPGLTRQWKKTAMSAAVAVALGSSATASADTINFSFTGLFTMLTSTGAPLQNTSPPFYSDATWGSGMRTQITGTLAINDATLEGSMTIVPFAFYNGGNAVATSIAFQPIGSNLLLGNMGFNWNGNNGIPVSLVWDGTALLSAVNVGMTGGQTLNAASAGAALPASNGMKKSAFPIGNVPLATTTWNTTTIGGAGLGTNPSGTTPIIADVATGTPGGSPMIAGPFTGFNANFDLQSMTVTSIVLGVDTNPDAFSFTSTAPLQNAVTASNTITITGITTATAISIAGGLNSEYSIDGGAWTNAPGTIRNNHTVQVRHTAAAGFGATTTTTLTIGGVPGTFSSTTAAADTTPAAFGFTTQTGVAISTAIDSDIITPADFNSATAITVANGSYQINGAGGFVTGAGTLNPGDTVQVRHTSVGTFSSTGTTTLTIGGIAGTFSTTTVASDTTPDAFTFAAQSGVVPSTTITSNAITVAGINDPSTPISVSGGSYSINGGAYTSSPGTVANGQTVNVRHTSSGSSVTAVSSVLNIGGVTSTFTSTTQAANAVAFSSAFTMLDGSGSNVGRDTAVTGTYDYTTNTSSTGTNFNMTLQSVVPFFGNQWTAHDIRVFGPGTYTVNSACTAAEIRANGGASCAASGPALTFTVNAGQLGAHILFDWNNNNDIDVAQVWNTDYSASAVPASAGIVYKYSTQDGNGDGIAGFPMVAGPFIGFNANFDIKFSNYTSATASVGTVGALTELTAPSSGMPANFTAGSGAVQFVVAGVGSGGSATIVVSAPNLKANDKAYWVDGNGAYHEITSVHNVAYDYNAKTVSYTVTDNGFGDTDGLQNGSISDPFVLLTPVPQLGSSSGGGGGGCAMNGADFDPTLPGSLLAALAWLGWRRRSSGE